MDKILKVHSVNDYALFIGDEELEELSYGQIRYTLHQHALMCVAPGQIGGKMDTGEEIHTKGWALLFDTELLRNSGLGRRIRDYHFFSYNTSEALLMSPEQRQSIVGILELMRQELGQEEDEHTLRIVTSQIEQILEYVSRYYALQLSTSATLHIRRFIMQRA